MKRTIRTEEELLEASRAFLSAGYAEDIKNDETLTFTPLSLSDVDPSGTTFTDAIFSNTDICA